MKNDSWLKWKMILDFNEKWFLTSMKNDSWLQWKMILCPIISPHTKFHPNRTKNTEVRNFHFWSILVGRAGWSKNGRSHFKHSESLKRLTKDLCTRFEPNRTKIGKVSPFWNFFSKIEIWLVGPVCVCRISSRIRFQSTMSWQVTMQNFNLISQSVLKLSHCEKGTRRRRRRRQRQRRRRHPPGLNYSPRRNVFRRGQKERIRRERESRKITNDFLLGGEKNSRLRYHLRGSPSTRQTLRPKTHRKRESASRSLKIFLSSFACSNL
jgi:hypothetical protein